MGLNNWLKQKRNGEDLGIAFFILLDMIGINILISFFTSYLNHPARYFSTFEKFVIIPLGAIIVPILLIILIIFQIKITRKGVIGKIFKKYYGN